MWRASLPVRDHPHWDPPPPSEAQCALCRRAAEAAVHDDDHRSPRTSSKTATAMRQRVIVLAEDDPSLRELLTFALELDGHCVTAVRTGTELVDHVQRAVLNRGPGGNVDLLITDVRMPEMDGLLALKILRDADIAIPVILLTAFGDRWTRAEAAGQGALLLNKPIELWRLRGIVKEMLAAQLQDHSPSE